MSTYLNGLQLAEETVKLSQRIDSLARQIWPSIKATRDYNEIGLIKLIFDKVDDLKALNTQYLRKEHLTELDLTNENYALGDDIMDAMERLWPTIKKTRDRIMIQYVFDLATAANRILIINKAYAQKKVMKEATDIAEAAFEDEV